MQSLPRFEDENLLVGAEGFSDAGVYRLRSDLLIVQSLDFFPPLVDDPFAYGQIAAANSLSDIYAMGARPTTAMNIVGFPDDRLELSVLTEILRGGADRVKLAECVVVGGHTVRDHEIKYGLSVTGVVAPEQLLTNAGAQPGDRLLLTKPLGTGFITTAFKAGRCPEQVLNSAIESMRRLNRIASEAAVTHRANAVTDITGFGLVGHAGEMAQASHVTIALDVPALPLLPGALDLAREGNRTRASGTNRRFAEEHLKLVGKPDELHLEFCFDAQTSGGLLISVPESRALLLQETIDACGEPVPPIVGTVLPYDGTWIHLNA